MGAVPAIGAGLSIVGGLANANKSRASAAAQRKAIESQAQIDQLNSQLQLLALRNQAAMASVEDVTTRAAESQAYLSRMAQLGLQESQNAIALANAKTEATTASAMASAQEGTTNANALQELASSKQSIGNALVDALGASSEDTSRVLGQLQQLNPSERASAISALMDAAASSGGSNAALQLLNEFETSSVGGQVLRAEQLQQTKAAQAKTSATAATAQANAGYGTATALSAVERANTQYQAGASLLDANTAEKVGEQAFAAERTATSGAYNASQISRGVSTAARDLTNAANQEVVSRGASLSSATASAQASAARGAGFFDYLAVGANGFSTYVGLGGNTSFIQGSK